MEKFISNPFYEINFNRSNNRMYLKLIGYWKTPQMAPDYVNDIEKASSLMEGPFTLIADLTDFKTPPFEMNVVHQNAQKAMLSNGLSMTAEIVTDVVMKMVTQKIAADSTMRKKEFTTVQEGEKWLDSNN